MLRKDIINEKRKLKSENKELQEIAVLMIKCIIESLKFKYKYKEQIFTEHNLKWMLKLKKTKGLLIFSITS